MTRKLILLVPVIPRELLDLLQSPEGNPLLARRDVLVDEVTGKEYPIREGVPDLRPEQPKETQFDYQAHYQLDAELFDYFEEHSGEHAHEERRVHEAIMSYVPKAAKSILDAGCGSAWVAEAYLNQGKFVCSMDISTKNPEQALKRFPSPRHGGLVADAFRLPIKPGSFDVIIASEIIEHVIDPKEFVHSLYRALKPGGRLILSTPYKEKLRYVLCIHCNQQTPVHAHIQSFDEKKLMRYAPQGAKTMLKTFGNKVLFHLRTHAVMGLLPYKLWSGIDAAMNRVINKREHIVVVYEKP